MKPPRSIQWRIAGVVMVFGCAMILLNHWRNESWVTRRLLQRLEHDAADTASRLSGVLQHLARKQQERAAELEMSYVSLSDDVEIGVVCGLDGVIRCSTHPQWSGLHVSETPAASDWANAQSAMKHMTNFVGWNAAGDRLTAASAFFETYNSDDKAVVLVRYDPAHSLLQVRDDAWQESVIQAELLMILILLVWFALDEAVSRPVGRLVEQMRSAGSGGVVSQPPGGNNELAWASREFARTLGQLNRAERDLLDATEMERRRIGQDIHDDLCQRLTATKMKTEVMINTSSESGPLAREVVAELTEAVSIARGLARGLSPVGVDTLGMKGALEDVGRFLKGAYRTSCDTECDDLAGHMDLPSQEQLLRVVQELAVNACKHAAPTHLSINVRANEGGIEATVLHNGCRFDPAQAAHKAGMGLALIMQRLRTLGGTLERVEEGGCQLAIVRVPSASPVAIRVQTTS